MIAQNDLKACIEAMADEAGKGCGQIHDLYVRKFSGMVDVRFGLASDEVRNEAIQIARQFDYSTPEELAADADEMAESGFCSHGLDPNCCPLGCGDLE